MIMFRFFLSTKYKIDFLSYLESIGNNAFQYIFFTLIRSVVILSSLEKIVKTTSRSGSRKEMRNKEEHCFFFTTRPSAFLIPTSWTQWFLIFDSTNGPRFWQISLRSRKVRRIEREYFHKRKNDGRDVHCTFPSWLDLEQFLRNPPRSLILKIIINFLNIISIRWSFPWKHATLAN